MRKHPRKAAAAVEFAIVAPILFLCVILPTFEFGRGLMVAELVTNAARSGCRVGVLPGNSNSTVTSAVNTSLSDQGITGATTTVTPEEVPKVAADVLLECSGVGSAILDGLRALAPAGRAVLIGMSPSSETPVPIAAIQNRELELTGSFRYANTYPAALELLAAGLFDTDQLISVRFPLEQAEQALTALRSDGSVLKPMVVVGT